MNLSDTVKEEFRKQPISTTGAIAGLIMFANGYFSVPSLVSANASLPVLDVGLVLMLCLFFVLEGSLASVFSRLFVFIRLLSGGFPQVFMFVNALMSAWVTGFNCLWMFAPYSSKNTAEGVFFVTMLLGWAISVYLMNYHFDKRKIYEVTNSPEKEKWGIESKFNGNFWLSFAFNLIAFIFVYFYLLDDVSKYTK